MHSSERKAIGAAIPRREDLRFLTGAGQYSDDLPLNRHLFAAFVRSDHAHAEILSIHTDEAAKMPGVVAVLTGRDYQTDGLGPILHNAIEGDPIRASEPAFKDTDPVALSLDQWPMPADKVRHVGEAVAMVIAETNALAQDAAEAVVVEFEEITAVVDVHQAAAEGAPRVRDDAPGNICIHAFRGQIQGVSEALAASDHVVQGEFVVSRIVSCFMEPRAGLAEYDAENDKFTITAGNQGVHRFRMMIAGALNCELSKIRVVCPDTGGAFGSRGHANPEYVLIAWVAKRLGRPVRFTNIRSESFVTDWQGRDMVLRGELGLTRDGRFTGYRLAILANNGAHTVCYAPQANATRLITTVYDLPVACLEHKVYLTNTVPVLPFRAAGRPEVTYAIERLIDLAAHEFGFDRKKLRLNNLIKQSAMPYTNPVGLKFDVGNFPGAVRQVAELAEWNGYIRRQSASMARGLLRGISIVPFVESPVGAPMEMVRVQIGRDGKTLIHAGTQNHGQGHETTYAQVASELLGVPFEDVFLAQGDSDALPIGGGTHSDRSMRMVGELLCEAADELIAKARPEAAKCIQANVEDVVFEDGLFRSDSDGATISIIDVIAASDRRDGLSAEASRKERINAFPYGAAIAEVEIDPETGHMTICRYTAVNDSGTLINPMIVQGQTHGGIVQGVGQATCEAAIFDRSSGQLITGSFMDYSMPRADLFPAFQLGEMNVPTNGNRLGVKAGGEAGTVPALAVIGNAVLDALRPLGVTECEMPFSASRIWEAIQRPR